MPGYIGFRPQFNPISLQEYLTVPTMVINEYNKAEEKFEEYQDKAEQLAAMVGEDPYGRQIINNYKNQLQSATDAMSDGRIQNAEGLRQALGARKYYRENMMPLEVGIPYWEQYKKAKLALGEDPLEDPLTLESFVRNPAQAYSFTKGSDVRNLAANMTKAASARRIQDPKYLGRVNNGDYYRTKSESGFSDKEIQDWIAGAPNPDLDEIRNEVQNQFGNVSKDKLERFIKEGVYIGAIYDKKFEDKAVPKATSSSSSGRDGSGKDDLYSRFTQSLPSPDEGSQPRSKDNETIANKILAGPVTNGTVAAPYLLNNDFNNRGAVIPFAANQPKRYEGTLSASADFYRNEASKTKAANQSNDHLINSLNETFGRNAKESYLKFNDRSLKEIRNYGKGYFSPYKSINEVPSNVIDKFINSLRYSGNVGGMLPNKPNKEQINMLVDIGFSGTQNIIRNAEIPNTGYLTKKEFDYLKKQGIRFYNSDGTVRNERDILWDAWDIIMPKQYEKYSVTTTQGAGKEYSASATKEYLDEFPKAGTKTTTTGEQVTLYPNKDRTGFIGYGDPQYHLSSRAVRQNNKIMVVTSENGEKTHTIDVPLSKREKNVINYVVKDQRAKWLETMVKSGLMSMQEADKIASYSVPDFLKFLELLDTYPDMYGGAWSNYPLRINDDIINILDDALIKDNEMNFIQSNSETEGKLYN